MRTLRCYEADLSADGAPAQLGVYAWLHYGFVIPVEAEFLAVRAVESDLGRLVQAMDDIDAFVREIRCAHEPLSYANGQTFRRPAP